MRYVNAGYIFILTVLFLYAVQLAWRRRRSESCRCLTASGDSGR